MFNFSFVITICALFSVLHMNSQNIVSYDNKKLQIEGIVVDSINNPIINATVIFENRVSNIQYGTSTDEDDGYFSIILPAGDYSFHISAIGLNSYEGEVSLNDNKRLPKIILQEKKILLNEIFLSTRLNKKIKHSAIGMTVDIRSDSLLKNISAEEILQFLPQVQVTENGSILLQGESATVMIDGKFQKISKERLNSLLINLRGENIENIELINSPSAKYDGRLKKVININIQKNKNNGLDGSISNRITNADFSISPTATLDYKIDKLIFGINSSPYTYDKISMSNNSTQRLLDNSVKFEDQIFKDNLNISKNINLSVDYTISDRHSIYINYGISRFKTNNNISSIRRQFAFEEFESDYFSNSNNVKISNSSNMNFGYRYDIGKNGIRLDYAGTFTKSQADTKGMFFNQEIRTDDNSELFEEDRENLVNNIQELSTRLDFTLPLQEKKQKFEVGVKYDYITIANNDIFESLNTETNVFELNSNFSNSFEYRENVISAYTSLDNNLNKLKYSIGFRFENILTQSISLTENTTFENTFNNFLPVISLKYMTNDSETNNINLSYRKGYLLPPYEELNPFEIFINNTTIRRGNPNLKQSIYHSLNLGFTLKNKYFLSLNTYFYNNYFASSQVLENDTNIISYTNVGDKTTTRISFNTNYRFYNWWRVYVNANINSIKIKSNRVDVNINNYFFSLNNTFKFSEDFRLNIVTSISNGNSTGFENPNNFVRLFSSASISKSIFNNKISISFRAIDIFSTNNKNKDLYVIDNTEYTDRLIIQAPKMFLDITYKFNSGKTIEKKVKKKSLINGSRF